MNQQSKQPSMGARVGAVSALAIAAIVVLIAIVGAISGGGSSSTTPGDAPAGEKTAETVPGETPKRASYEIREGDTLTGIAEKTGVSVSELERLNPGLDPQALIAGQKLKLR